jgi:hypothetical protein
MENSEIRKLATKFAEFKTEKDLNIHILLAHTGSVDSKLLGFSSFDMYDAVYRNLSLQYTYDQIKIRIEEILEYSLLKSKLRKLLYFRKFLSLTKDVSIVTKDFLKDRVYQLDMFAYLQKMTELNVAQGNHLYLMEKFDISIDALQEYLKTDLNHVTLSEKKSILSFRQNFLRTNKYLPPLEDLSKYYDINKNQFIESMLKLEKKNI